MFKFFDEKLKSDIYNDYIDNIFFKSEIKKQIDSLLDQLWETAKNVEREGRLRGLRYDRKRPLLLGGLNIEEINETYRIWKDKDLYNWNYGPPPKNRDICMKFLEWLLFLKRIYNQIGTETKYNAVKKNWTQSFKDLCKSFNKDMKLIVDGKNHMGEACSKTLGQPNLLLNQDVTDGRMHSKMML